MHSKSPWLKDKFSRNLFKEPKENRPPAWSKVDAVLEALQEGGGKGWSCAEAADAGHSLHEDMDVA